MSKKGKKFIWLVFLFTILIVFLFVILIYNSNRFYPNEKKLNGSLGTIGILKDNAHEHGIAEGNESIYDKLSLRNNVLIIYNSNANDSRDIAEYYANARGIDYSRLCEIKTRTGNYASHAELLSARQSMINCICNILPINEKPNPCNSKNISEIAKVSPITYLVLIRGIPPRLNEDTWINDSYWDSPSFDYYLSRMLYQPDGYLNGTSGADNESSYYDLNSFRGYFGYYNSTYMYIRPINASIDKIAAYGRIEEMTKERTYSLIDKTVEAENKGYSGNFLLEIFGGSSGFKPEKDNVFNFFRDISSSRSSICKDYLNTSSAWPYQYCRTGAVANGNIPGESGTNILRAINAGIFMGNDPGPNGMSAFDGFYNMLNWHKSEYNCTTLCKNFSNPDDEASCRTNSTDYFKEINTDCVGAANGFIGWQFRSYPVQYFGFWPSKFGNDDSGGTDKTPPIILEGGGYQNSRFSDDKYLHYGALDQVTEPICNYENGTNYSCPEYIDVDLFISNSSLNISPGNNASFEVKFRHRNTKNNLWFWSGYFRVAIETWLSDGTKSNYSYIFLNLNESNSDWKMEDINFSINNTSDKNITRVNLRLNSESKELQNWFDLDGVELIDLNTGRELIDTDTGSFNNPYIGYVYDGDWASNAIVRLGAIAWWGSSSHFLTNGYAFSGGVRFPAAFFSGRSLGESLAYLGSNAKSGIAYGDPLYKPSGVKIFSMNPNILFNSPVGYSFKINTNSSKEQVYINAFHGQGNLNTTNWKLFVCSNKIIDYCDSNSKWISFESGENAEYEYPIKANLSYLAKKYNLSSFIIKLVVWNPWGEGNGLTNYAYFNNLGCVPFTCSGLNASCGKFDNGCYGLIDCGASYDYCIDYDKDGHGDNSKVLTACNFSSSDDYRSSDDYSLLCDDKCPYDYAPSNINGNEYGCPPIKWDKFKNNFSTNLSLIENYSNISLILGSDKGIINFIDNVSIWGLNFDNDVKIGNNYVEINTTGAPELNVSAKITLFNILSSLTDIKILEDGKLCSDCSIINYSRGIIIFNVSHFTKYEAAGCGDKICNGGETCETCAGDCGSCTNNEGRGSGGSGGFIFNNIKRIFNSSNLSENNQSSFENNQLNESSIENPLPFAKILKSNYLEMGVLIGILVFIILLILIALFEELKNKKT